jgi:hypothetical protein
MVASPDLRSVSAICCGVVQGPCGHVNGRSRFREVLARLDDFAAATGRLQIFANSDLEFPPRVAWPAILFPADHFMIMIMTCNR